MPRSGLAASHRPHTLYSARHTSIVAEDVLHTMWTEITRPHVVPARAPAAPLLPAKNPPEAHSEPREYAHEFVSHFWHSVPRQSPTAPNANNAPPSQARREKTWPTQPAPHPPLQSATAARNRLATDSYRSESVSQPTFDAPLPQVRPPSSRIRPQFSSRLYPPHLPPAPHNFQPPNALNPPARADPCTQPTDSPSLRFGCTRLEPNS